MNTNVAIVSTSFYPGSMSGQPSRISAASSAAIMSAAVWVGGDGAGQGGLGGMVASATYLADR